jgi:tRNA dimethylallyltransferase
VKTQAREERKKGLVVPGIVGPTAVGKTGVAVEIAEAHGWEIVSADSRQVYRLLDIGTAKPTPQERSRAPHHLIDTVPPREAYSCGRYRREATAAVEAILAAGKIPLVVGGSGLYLRALGSGLFEGPERDESLREELRRQAEREGRESLHEKLVELDPASAERIHPRDLERTVRAIEVFRITGKPISRLQRTSTVPGPFELRLVGLRRARESLYRMINERFDMMLEAGFVDEVRELVARGFSEAWPSFRTVGYREIVEHLRGEIPLEVAREKAKTRTRRFAKRQLTWFAGAVVGEWVDVSDGEHIERTAERVSGVLRNAGLSV